MLEQIDRLFFSSFFIFFFFFYQSTPPIESKETLISLELWSQEERNTKDKYMISYGTSHGLNVFLATSPPPPFPASTHPPPPFFYFPIFFFFAFSFLFLLLFFHVHIPNVGTIYALCCGNKLLISTAWESLKTLFIFKNAYCNEVRNPRCWYKDAVL